VLGIGGLMGAGRTELLMHLFGAWGRGISGTMQLRGQSLGGLTPETIIQKGLVLASEDRRRYGLHLEHEIGFNLSLSSLAGVTRGGFIQRNAEIRRNQGIFDSLRVKATGLRGHRRQALRRQSAEGRARQGAADRAVGHSAR
jgi:D-xylose transport system ATP-binding protein